MHQTSAPLPPQARPRPHQPRTSSAGEQQRPGEKIKECTGAGARDPQAPSKLRLFLSQKSASAAGRLLKRPPDPERKGSSSSRLPKPKIWGGLHRTVQPLNYSRWIEFNLLKLFWRCGSCGLSHQPSLWGTTPVASRTQTASCPSTFRLRPL